MRERLSSLFFIVSILLFVCRCRYVSVREFDVLILQCAVKSFPTSSAQSSLSFPTAAVLPCNLPQPDCRDSVGSMCRTTTKELYYVSLLTAVLLPRCCCRVSTKTDPLWPRVTRSVSSR